MKHPLTLDQLDSHIAWLVEQVGADWLSAQLQGGADSRHPIAEWIRLTRVIASDERLLVEQSYRIARLAHAWRRLAEARLLDAKEVAGELKSGDTDKFSATHQEVITAADYLERGHAVEFIPEGTERKPDLLIDSTVEIECKVKASQTAKDGHRQELYDLLWRRAVSANDQPDTRLGLLVRARFLSEPTREGVDEVVRIIRKVSRADGPRSVTCKLGDVHYLVRGYVSPPAQSPYAEKFLDFKVGSDLTSDSVKSILKSLKDAARQFSQARAALIHVDITDLLHGLIKDDHMERLYEVVRNFLSNHSTVSGVILDSDQIIRFDHGIMPYRSSEVILNRAARIPVSPEFVRPSTTAHASG